MAELTAESLAEPQPWELTHFTLFWENDGVYVDPFSSADRHYTNGLKIDFAFDPNLSPEAAQWLAPSDRWTDPKFAVGFVVSQQIYTGYDITDSNPPANDRPWAGYLYGGVYFQRADDTKHDHFEIDIGLVGRESQAQAVQEWVHSAFPDQDDPVGWSDQLAHELTVNFGYRRSWRSERSDLGSGMQIDAIPRVGFDAGNVFVRAVSEVTVRVGKNMPDDFGPPRLLGFRDATGSWSPDSDWGVYGYFRFGIAAVAHNIFLDGNTFATSASTNRESLVGEVGLGVMAHYRDIEFGWAWTAITDEYDQRSSDSYGSLVVSWVRRF